MRHRLFLSNDQGATMTTPLNLRGFGILSPGEKALDSTADEAAFELFTKKNVAQPAPDAVAGTPTSNIKPVDTEAVKLTTAGGPAKFWPARANQANKLTEALTQLGQTPDAAKTTAALQQAKELFATLNPREGSVDGKPTATQLEAIKAAFQAFVPLAQRALSLLGEQPKDQDLQSALKGAVGLASETATDAKLAELAALVYARLPKPE